MSDYYISCTELGVHQPRAYDPQKHGHSVKTYASLEECQAECDRLNADPYATEEEF